MREIIPRKMPRARHFTEAKSLQMARGMPRLARQLADKAVNFAPLQFRDRTARVVILVATAETRASLTACANSDSGERKLRRYIESALRLKLRLIISALLVFGIASTALFFSKGGYTSGATIWVEKPPFGFSDPNLFPNPYASVAFQQAERFNQYLRTYAFALNIAKKVGMDMPTAAAEGSAVDDIQKNLVVTDLGPNLVGMVYTGKTPEFCEPIVREAIALFAEEITSNRETSAQAALGIYNAQLDEAEARMNKAKDDLDRYLRANPQAGLGGDQPDPNLNALNLEYQTARTAYDDIRLKIQNINNQTASNTALLNSIWRVVDKPDVAEPYRMTLKDLLKNSVIAFVMGLLTMVAITLVGTWTDQAVYTLNDISAIATAIGENGPAPELLVGLVPYIKPLGQIRKELAKQQKSRRGGKRGARVTVLDGTEVVTRHRTAGDATRQPDGLIDVPSSAHARQ